MTESEKIYLAGVFDSSGTINIIRAGRFGNPMPLIELRRDSRELLDVVAGICGGTVINYSARRWWYWKRVGRPAQAIIRDILPYMHVRKVDASRALLIKVGVPGRQRRAPLWDGLYIDQGKEHDQPSNAG